ncbi:MAG: HlyD family efflux transporter periplasmic adaptor subunit [Lachnospiraceae bacterium]|nr:HlyD family efflux transporter periplasmic adaptor subunit [Lachnospiraceae bacterium]
MEENVLALRKKKKKRNRIIIIVVIVLILAILVGSCINSSQKAAEALMNQVTTDTVTTRSLVSSVGTSGKIISSNSKNLTVNLTGVDVSRVDVEVGDVVNAGDELLAFDTSDIEENLEAAKDALNTAETQATNTVEDAQRALDDAQRTRDYSVTSANASVTNAYNTYQSAINSYNKGMEKLNELQSDADKAKTKKEDAKTDYDNAKSAAESAKSDYESASDDDKSAKKTAYETAKAAKETAKATYEAAKTAYETAKTAVETQQSTCDGLYSTMISAQAAYEASIRDYDNTVSAQDSSVQGAANSLETAKASAASSTDTSETTVKTYETQLEDGVLTAPFAGTVTAVNYEVGDTYTAGATLVTLQDCTTYEIEANVGEYDISNIELGQKVLIKTDATGDEELTGTVSFISPVSTTTESSSALATTSSTSLTGSSTTVSSATYRIKVALDEQNEKLRLDMSASLSIILESHDDVLTVPYNAIYTLDDGSTVIKEQIENEDGTTETKDIPVTVVMESNYYSEITGDEVVDGMTVLVQEENSSMEELMQLMIDEGGF